MTPLHRKNARTSTGSPQSSCHRDVAPHECNALRRRVAARVRALGAAGIVILTTLLVVGCATSGPLAISSRQGPAATEDPALQKLERTHVVRVRLLTPTFSSRSEQLPAFDVSVNNRAAAPLSFSAANVAVFSGTAPVRAYAAAELVAKIQKDAEREAAEKSAESAEKIFQTPGTKNDPSAAILMVERAKMMDQATQTRTASTEKLRELVNTIVPVSISPGGTGSGIVKLHAEDIAETKPLRVVVTIGSETYEFIFDVGRGGS